MKAFISSVKEEKAERTACHNERLKHRGSEEEMELKENRRREGERNM